MIEEAVLTASAGDITSKRWALTGSLVMWLAALVCYTVSSAMWLPLVRHKGLTVATTALSLTAIIVSLVVASCYGEPLTPAKILGVLLGIASVVVLSLSS